MPDQRFIVAEVSKNWDSEQAVAPPPDKGFICHLFEQLIEVNRQRGYRLYSFQLHRLLTGETTMNETIVAVFEKERV